MATETAAAAATPDAAAAAAAEASTGSLLSALLAVQAEAPVLPKDKTNPHFKSRFTGLDTIVELIGPLLAKHRLVWSAHPSMREGSPVLAYSLSHADTGEAMADTMPLLLSKGDMQGLGSALTYARRYALTTVLNLVADEDDDGTAATAKPADDKVLPALDDDRANGLRAEARELHAAISKINPERVREAKFNAWLIDSSHSHDRLTALRDHLRGVLDGLQGDGS